MIVPPDTDFVVQFHFIEIVQNSLRLSIGEAMAQEDGITTLVGGAAVGPVPYTPV